MTSTPRVSVVVADRRASVELARSLDAVADTEFAPGEVEVVVVSVDTDDTVAAARNRGAALARGEVLLFLDDDVLPERGLLAGHLNGHDASSRRAVVGGVRSRRPASDLAGAQVDLEASAHLDELIRPGHRVTYRDVSAGNLSMPAAVFREVGGFDGQLPAREGCELGIRLLRHGIDVRFAPEAGAWRDRAPAVPAWLARAHDEGRADVELVRLHGALSPLVQDARGDDPKVKRVLRRLTFEAPALTRRLTRWLEVMLTVARSAGERSLQRRLVHALRFLAYWQGVAAGASHRELVGLLGDVGHSDSPVDATVDVDLASGVDAAAARLDRERAPSARIWLGDREVGSIPAVPGAEALRGAHLHPLLAGPFAQAFARALQAHHASADRETTPQIKQLAAAAARTRAPLVSVIIPFLDAEPFLDEAISSIFDQTYSRWELILVDDGSTDGSTEIARSYAKRFDERVRYVTHAGRVNLGEGATRNRGIADARGEYVAFVDADDTWLPDKLDTQVPLLFGQPDVAAVWGPTLWWPPKVFDSVVEEVRHLAVETDRVWSPPDLAVRFIDGSAKTPGVMSALARRDVVQAVGGYDETLRIYADQVFFVRLCLRAAVYVHSTPLERYRLHDDSACSRAAQEGVFDADGGPSIMHARYLDRLHAHLRADGVTDPGVWDALERAALPYRMGSIAASSPR